jgi:multisubunit Na+/H+ antiporter MnhB subunit
MRSSLVLEASVRVLYPSILVLSVYFLFVGHNSPGGGFVGGLAAGAGIALRYVVGGTAAVDRVIPVRPWLVLGGGLALSVGTAMVPLVLGHTLLEHALFEVDVPVLHHVKATSALPFDIGVYLIVLGLVLMIFEAFGEEPKHLRGRVEAPRPPARAALDEYQPIRRAEKGDGG